jgi:SNF2 family DNA or RNA helicase
MVVGIESMATGGASELVRRFIAENKRIFCVVDESHLIKTHNANRTEKITILGRLCEYRTILTGTPIAASPLDLYSQFRFLDPDITGYSDFYSFKSYYAIMGGYENKQIIGYNNLEGLMREVAPYTFQVNAEEVADLPPKIYMTREIQLPQTAMKLYDNIKKHKLIEYNNKELILSNALDRLTRLSLLVNGVMTTGESGTFEYDWVSNAKISELMDLIQENPTPTVVWTTGRMELRKTVEALNKAGHATREIHGGVKEEDRIIAINDFQNGEVNYLVANTATGGTGIKLSRARMLVYMSNSFKYVDRKQSEERATDFLNPGDSVCVVDFIALNTVDDQIIQPALKAKMDVAMYVNDNIRKLKLNEGL